jgi:hypothetical protein
MQPELSFTSSNLVTKLSNTSLKIFSRISSSASLLCLMCLRALLL